MMRTLVVKGLIVFIISFYQAKERYKKLIGIDVRLGLKTNDGALLNHDDIVGNVIMNNEEILADVLGLELPPLNVRYQDECVNNGVGEKFLNLK